MTLDRTAELLTDEDFTAKELRVERILLPTDGSATAVEATSVAVCMARCFNAEIIALFVDPARTMDPLEALQEEHTEGIHHSRAGLDAAVRIGQVNGIKVTPVIAEGAVGHEIIGAARDHDVQMIIMGSEGRSGLKRFMLGSVAESVLREAHVPVTVVRHCSTEFCMKPRG